MHTNVIDESHIYVGTDFNLPSAVMHCFICIRQPSENKKKIFIFHHSLNSLFFIQKYMVILISLQYLFRIYLVQEKVDVNQGTFPIILLLQQPWALDLQVSIGINR